MASSSMKDLLQEYHRLAADTLLGAGSNTVAVAILEAAESGQVERLKKLLAEHPSLVDTRQSESGDTPIIAAARNGHREVVDLLLSYGADVTLENDCQESVLDVAAVGLRSYILKSMTHGDRSMTNAQALLQSAWLGDAVSVKRCLSGAHYLDVNCTNRNGLTPLLLVTKDVSLFTEVQNAMETDYNPVEVLEGLLANHADVNRSDRFGRSPLHLIASSGPSIHATKMVSLLLQNGSVMDAQTSVSLSPLHVASSCGYVAVIVALVEEGGADLDQQAGEAGDTPLMLSVRGGYSEAARYLLSKGADVTIVTETGDSALSVAGSPNMRRMIRDAWTEQAQRERDEAAVAEATPPRSDNEDNGRGSPIRCTPSPRQPDLRSFFLTDRQISKSLDFEAAELISPVGEFPVGELKPANESFGSAPYLAHEHHDGPELEVERRGRSHSQVESPLQMVAGMKRKGPKGMRRANSDAVIKHMGGSRVRALQAGEKEVGYGSADEALASRRAMHSGKETAAHTASQHPVRERQAPEQRRGEKVGKRGKRGQKKAKSLSKGLSSQPSNLLTQRSVTGRRLSDHVMPRMSHDRYTPGGLSYDGHMSTEAGSEVRRDLVLPEVFIYSSPPSSKPTSTLSSPSSCHDNRLPSLNLKNMKPVAIVAVDTKRDNLRVRRFGHAHQSSGQESPIQRSKSLMNVSGGKAGQGKKRNSTGSMADLVQADTADAATGSTRNAKAVLLPNVVTPQFSVSLPPPAPPPPPNPHQVQTHLQGRLLPVKFSPAPPKPHLVSPTLSVVNEDSESLASTLLVGSFLSRSDHTLTSRPGSSEASTLRASSHSDFETDSLERGSGTLQPHATSTSPLAQYVQQAPPITRRPSTQSSMSISALPPTMGQFLELTRQTSHTSHAPSHVSHTPSSNTVVNYAVQEGSTPLSLIWNHTQDSRSPSEVSTSSEYITSYVGALSSAASAHALDPNNPVPSLDSGQGESADEERGVDTSSGSASEAEPHVVDTRCLKWKRGRLLGKGAYGKVWEGLLDSAKMIAVKEVELDIAGQRAQSQYEKLRIEVEILRSLRHKNVVSYLGTSMDEGLVYIFMEFISGGSLQSILKRFGPLDDKTSSHYTKQIVRALNYLHSNGIVHRDIKGANVMVTSRGVIKLIDFGCAKQSCQDISRDLHSVRGTPYWMAPEVIRGEGYGRKSDIWSLGCTVHEMAISKPPWGEHPPEAAIFQIGMGRPIPQLPSYLSKKVVSFILRCVMKEQLQRPSASELLDDPFLTSSKKRRNRT